MPRHFNRRETMLKARAARQRALSRPELRRDEGVERISASGLISAPIKAENPDDRRLIDEFLARRGR